MALRNGCSRLGLTLRLAAAALISGSALLLAGASAEAHHYRHYRNYRQVAHSAHFPHYAHRWRVHPVREAAAIPSSPAFSAIVVDANSGRTLYSVEENGLRHPASITKVMTLYLLFEQLDGGAMTLHTEIPISEHAAAQEPSKLGLRPGDMISVEDAIKAVVTRSANDVAVAIAEAVGRSEDNFAEMMTRKARELGMSSTLYRNASGLPNDEQVTTARDLAILAGSLEDRFPRYFHYFSTAEFEYRGEVIGNHNHLLGRVDGVDGIKTGYTRASGFNLLTSVHRDGRSVIAVVMGGRSAAGRDRIMEGLIADHLAEASTERTTTAVANAAPPEEPPARQRVAAQAARVADPDAEPPTGEGDNADGDDEGPAARETAAPITAPRPAPIANAPAPAPERAPTNLSWTQGPETAAAPKNKQSEPRAEASAKLPPLERRRGAGVDGHRKHQQTQEETTIVARVENKAPGLTEVRSRDDAGARGSWMIQIGATGDLAEANALLSRARERNRATLAAAKPVTEKVPRGEGVIYRARFAMLDSTSAESACRSLKRNGFSCFPARD